MLWNSRVQQDTFSKFLPEECSYLRAEKRLCLYYRLTLYPVMPASLCDFFLFFQWSPASCVREWYVCFSVLVSIGPNENTIKMILLEETRTANAKVRKISCRFYCSDRSLTMGYNMRCQRPTLKAVQWAISGEELVEKEIRCELWNIFKSIVCWKRGPNEKYVTAETHLMSYDWLPWFNCFECGILHGFPLCGSAPQRCSVNRKLTI